MTSIKLLGLLGYPVSHSLSPVMHNAALKHCKIDARYQLFETKIEAVPQFFSSVPDSSIGGFNVTIPYKEIALDYVKLPEASADVKAIGALNTVVKDKKDLLGYNTDIPGFTRDLREKNVDVFNKRVAILGAGGATRAIAYALCVQQVREIKLFDIDLQKAKNITTLVKTLFPDIVCSVAGSIKDLEMRQKDILINATPVGMKPGDGCLVEESQLSNITLVYDLIYNPAQTPLLKIARFLGIPSYNGLGMLLWQGALSFEHFTGVKAPVEVMKKALEETMSHD